MFDSLIQPFIALLVVIDPVGMAPIFVGLTHGIKPKIQRQIAVRAVLLATAVLFAFALGGNALLDVLGISLPAFRIAGGVLLFLLAVEMLFARESGLRSTTKGELEEADHRKDITVFPLAIPLIAGPGSMTTVVLLMGDAGTQPQKIIEVLGLVALTLLLVLVSFLLSVQLNRLLGVTGANVISRVLGIILASLAVQFILDGLSKVFSLS